MVPRYFTLGVFAFAVALAGGLSPGPARSDTVVQMDFGYGYPGVTVGSVQVQLFDGGAPITVDNFLLYVGNNDYDYSMVHRSVPGFVVQGGNVRLDATGAAWELVPNYGTIANEFDPSRSNVRGTIAMAKQPDNPNSASNQWFFNVADNSANLDSQNGGFTVFGQVLGSGMTLLDAVNGCRSYAAYMSELDPPNTLYYYSLFYAEAPVIEFTDGSADFILVTHAAVVAPPSVFDWKGANAQNLTPSYWGRADNWGPTFGVPDGAGAAVTLGNQGAGSSIVDLQATGRTVGTLNFEGSTATTIQGAGTLTFHNGATEALLTVSAGSHAIAAPVSLGSDLRVAVDGALLTLAGTVGGTGSLTKNGPGTLTLSGIAAYQGHTTVNAGTLQLAGGIAAGGTPSIDVQGGTAVLATTGVDRPDLNVATAAGAGFEIDGGSHVLGDISGAGATRVVAGSLTANRIVQDTLSIGAGASVTIAPSGAAAGSATLRAAVDGLSPSIGAYATSDPVQVPEPGTLVLICVGGAAAGIAWLRRPRAPAGAGR